MTTETIPEDQRAKGNYMTSGTIRTPNYFCPKHGDQGGVIGVSVQLHDGMDVNHKLTPSLAARKGPVNYCMCCWIDWMDANMERLIGPDTQEGT